MHLKEHDGSRRVFLGGAAFFLPAFLLGCANPGKSRVFSLFPEGYLEIELDTLSNGLPDPDSGTLTFGLEAGVLKRFSVLARPFRDPWDRFQITQAFKLARGYPLDTLTVVGKPRDRNPRDKWPARAEVDIMEEQTLIAHWTNFRIDRVSLNDQPLNRLSRLPELENLVRI